MYIIHVFLYKSLPTILSGNGLLAYSRDVLLCTYININNL